MHSYEVGGVRVVELDVAGPLLASEENALDIIGEGFGTEADIFAIPVGRLAPGFLDLKTRLLGHVIQKFTNYRMRVVFLGDISIELAASKALRDFVYETNARGRILFARDRADLAALLG